LVSPGQSDAFRYPYFGVQQFYFAADPGFAEFPPAFDTIHQSEYFGSSTCISIEHCFAFGAFRADLTMGLALTGSIFSGNLSTVLDMRSEGPIWTIESLTSDNGPCNQFFNCKGGTGVWLLDRSTVRVLEPPTLALFVLVSVAMMLVRPTVRKRHRALVLCKRREMLG
jgi:hypothetical protein